MLPAVLPQLVANDGARALRQAIADPDRYACEPKVDGVRGLVVYGPEHTTSLRFVVFDVLVLLGTDLRGLPWHERRERLEFLARAFVSPWG